MRCPRCGWILNNLNKEKVDSMREMYPKAFTPWSPQDDAKLVEMVKEGKPNHEISTELERQPSAIVARIKLLQARSNPPEKELTTEEFNRERFNRASSKD